MAANAYYAKKIINCFYTKKDKISSVLSSKDNNLSRIKDIISWITFNDYSEAPVTGVASVYRKIGFDQKEDNYDSVINRKLTKRDLPELVQICVNNLRNSERTSEHSTQIHKKLIENEIIKTIENGDKQAIDTLLGWIKTEWESLSMNMQVQKINIDICKEYSKFAGIDYSSTVTPEGQEIIE